jgi:DNA-binding NarL/FixJ family response regulator
VIRVVVVDDHPLFRAGLEALLATVPDVEVVGSAGDGEAAVRMAVDQLPDVVLMDLSLPGMPGLEATRKITLLAPKVAVLVLTMIDDDDSVFAALRLGAHGYLLKGASQEEVLAALRTVAAGGAAFGVGIAEHLLAGRRPRGRYVGYDLTEREADVLAGIAGGNSNAEIARDLGLSVKTVQNHVSHLLAKLQVRDRTQAALRVRGL